MTIKCMFFAASMPLLLLSCSKEKPAQDTPQPLPKTFSFTQTNAVASAAEILTADNDKRSLKGDFNLDGLTDVAIIRMDGSSQNQVDIYIQAPTDPAAAGSAKENVSFFKGGTITRPDEGSIIGLASKADGRIVDIIMLVTYSNRPNEMIHYKNDGTAFTEVDF